MRMLTLSPPQADGDTALYVAAKAGHDEAVRALLEVQATKVNWQNHKGARENHKLLACKSSSP